MDTFAVCVPCAHIGVQVRPRVSLRKLVTGCLSLCVCVCVCVCVCACVRLCARALSCYMLNAHVQLSCDIMYTHEPLCMYVGVKV
jgi:hypothetical protein